MKKVSLSAQIGTVSAIMAITAITVYMLSFFAILIVNPLYIWSDFASYLAYQQQHPQVFKHIAQAMMLLFPLQYLLMLNSALDTRPIEAQATMRAGVLFALGFAVLAGMHYWVQITAVRLNLDKGTTDGLLQFIQAKPDSAMAAINMLGWTVFYGLSSLLAAPAFSGNKANKALRWAFIINGVNCLVGGIAYALDATLIVGVTMNLALGGCMLAISVLMLLHFRRLQTTSSSVAGRSSFPAPASQ
jgi:hypothetical protein